MLALMFRREAEEAVKSYVSLFSSVFGDSKILWTTYYGEEELEALRAVPEMTEDIMPGPAGSVRTIRFLLCGQEILALNGGGFLGNSLKVPPCTSAAIRRSRSNCSGWPSRGVEPSSPVAG